jgi:hypothetical protein
VLRVICLAFFDIYIKMNLIYQLLDVNINCKPSKNSAKPWLHGANSWASSKAMWRPWRA